MIDDKRLEEMAEEWLRTTEDPDPSTVYDHLVMSYKEGFRACEAKADKLAEVLRELHTWAFSVRHPYDPSVDLLNPLVDRDKINWRPIDNASKALKEYRGEKSEEKDLDEDAWNWGTDD